MANSQIKIGDGGWIDVTDLKVTLTKRPTSDAADALLYALSGLAERREEARREQELGIDPRRVINGETVRKEIEG